MTFQYQGRCLTRNGGHYCQDLKIIGEQIIENWWRKEGHHVDVDDVTDILAVSPELLIIGTGYAGFMEVSDSLRYPLRTITSS
jgi:hypothetical protein